MGRRVDILNAFTTWLQTGDYGGITLPPRGVTRGFTLLDSLNDFPHISYNVQDSSLVHISSNIRYYILSIALRAYVKDENAQAQLDDMMIAIENRVLTFAAHSDPSLEVVDARIESVNSDEGLMTPYGVTDMRLIILYQQNSSL
jgi:hypothetical protein